MAQIGAEPVGRESEAHPAFPAFNIILSLNFERYHLPPIQGHKRAKVADWQYLSFHLYVERGATYIINSPFILPYIFALSEFSIHRPILDGLGHVGRAYRILPGQVGDGPGDLEDAGVGPGA
jgi:hypothetical protein